MLFQLIYLFSTSSLCPQLIRLLSNLLPQNWIQDQSKTYNFLTTALRISVCLVRCVVLLPSCIRINVLESQQVVMQLLKASTARQIFLMTFGSISVIIVVVTASKTYVSHVCFSKSSAWVFQQARRNLFYSEEKMTWHTYKSLNGRLEYIE